MEVGGNDLFFHNMILVNEGKSNYKFLFLFFQNVSLKSFHISSFLIDIFNIFLFHFGSIHELFARKRLRYNIQVLFLRKKYA